MFTPYYVDYIRSDINQRYWMVHFKEKRSPDNTIRYGTIRAIYDSKSKNLYGWNYTNRDQEPLAVDQFQLNCAIFETGPEFILIGLEPENDEEVLIDWWERLDNETKEKNVKALDKLIVESML